VSLPGRGLASEKGPAVPIVQEAGWASELVWTYRLKEKTFFSAGDRTSVIQSVVRYYNDWATPAFVIRIILVVFFSQNSHHSKIPNKNDGAKKLK
jgi:hypothetical protein